MGRAALVLQPDMLRQDFTLGPLRSTRVPAFLATPEATRRCLPLYLQPPTAKPISVCTDGCDISGDCYRALLSHFCEGPLLLSSVVIGRKFVAPRAAWALAAHPWPQPALNKETVYYATNCVPCVAGTDVRVERTHGAGAADGDESRTQSGGERAATLRSHFAIPRTRSYIWYHRYA